MLQPELINTYAADMVRKLRKHPKELACISKYELLALAVATRISSAVVSGILPDVEPRLPARRNVRGQSQRESE